MPGNTQIKPMKLIFSKDGDTWGKTVFVIETGDIIIQDLGLKFFPEEMDKTYFDNWQTQMENIPMLNIVEVERFL